MNETCVEDETIAR